MKSACKRREAEETMGPRLAWVPAACGGEEKWEEKWGKEKKKAARWRRERKNAIFWSGGLPLKAFQQTRTLSYAAHGI